jgi:hypothetical protein
MGVEEGRVRSDGARRLSSAIEYKIEDSSDS